MAAKIYRINYKSDFVLTINSDAGWAVPFCIKFWTGMPSQAYFAGFDGENYVNCRVGETPTQLLVMFDDHHMPIGELKMQIAYHTTIEEFPDRKFDEVTNPTNVTVDIDGTEYQVMLDFTGETGAEIDFSMPSSGVMSVNGKIGYVTLNAEDVGAQPTIEDLATIRSGAAEGATAVQPDEMTAALATKQDVISDLATIRSGAAAGATAVQPAALQEGLAEKQDTISDLATIRSGAEAGATAVQPDEMTAALAGKQNVIEDLSTIRSGAAAGATAVQPAAMNTALAAKQDTLTFDNTPTANSDNPVKSGGIKTALDAKQSTISTVNVTVDNNTGTPSGTASVSGSTLSLSFQNLKGATGATGATGPQGPQGERGLPGESGVTGDVSGFTVIQTIDPSATYGATDIAGAATVQATNAELTELEGKMLSSFSIIDTSTFDKNSKFINSSNAWAVLYNTQSINIPVEAGETYVIESNSTNGAIYAFLKSNTTVGDPVDFSSELNHRVVLSAGQNVTVVIPSDTTILYLFANTSDGNFLPSKLTKKNIITDVVDNINEDIEDKNISIPNMVALEEIYKDKTIDLSSYGINTKYISSSNVWVASTGSNNRSINIPVEAGETYVIESNSTNGAIYAFLKSNTTVGDPVDFSDSLNHRVVLSAGQSETVEIPDDTTILYLFVETTHGTLNFLPSRFVKLSKITQSIGSLDVLIPRFVFTKGVMMGDSITAGVYSYFNNEQRWNGVQAGNGISDYIGEIIRCRVDNVGKRGSGYVIDTRNINNALEQAMITDYSQYDLCIMMYGVNDYIKSAPIGNLTDNIEGTVMGNMSRVFEKIVNDNPYCKILCVGSYNTWGQVSQGGDYISEEYYGDATTDYGLGHAINGNTLRQYLDAQQEVCEHYHVQYFCLADEGIVNTFNIKNVLVDGLHPTLELRKYIAQEIVKYLV